MSGKVRSLFVKRRQRIRFALKKKAGSVRLRLTVFRSNQHIYAQLIDDSKSSTVVSASTLDKQLDIKGSTNNMEAAKAVGKMIAERAKKLNVSKVVFDRSGYIYHGKVKALADAARDGGLLF